MFHGKMPLENDSSNLSNSDELKFNPIDKKSNFQKTAFMIELMLIDREEEKK